MPVSNASLGDVPRRPESLTPLLSIVALARRSKASARSRVSSGMTCLKPKATTDAGCGSRWRRSVKPSKTTLFQVSSGG